MDPPDELVRRAARGDAPAIARIVRLHHEEMTRVAFVVVADLGAAVRATDAAWPAAWDGLRGKRVAEGLGPWLCSLAVAEAIFITSITAMVGAPAAEPLDDTAGDGIARALARLNPDDRALLALHHLAGLPPNELARTMRQSPSDVVERLHRLDDEVDGPPLPRSDPALTERRVGRRLRAYADVPVRPVDADAVARRARAEEDQERTRLVSVAVSVVIGGLVATAPYWAPLISRH